MSLLDAQEEPVVGQVHGPDRNLRDESCGRREIGIGERSGRSERGERKGGRNGEEDSEETHSASRERDVEEDKMGRLHGSYISTSQLGV